MADDFFIKDKESKGGSLKNFNLQKNGYVFFEPKHLNQSPPTRPIFKIKRSRTLHREESV